MSGPNKTSGVLFSLGVLVTLLVLSLGMPQGAARSPMGGVVSAGRELSLAAAPRHELVGEQGPAFFYPQRWRARQALPQLEINLTNNPADDVHPAWSPDGQTIAFSSNRDGTYDIWLMNPDGSNLRKLTDDPGNARYPAWSASGSRLAYTSDREGINDLYFLDLTTRREQRVTQNLGNITHPTWSPSG
ncbi:MAG TPA: hypothetical protein EYP85_04015, partial [Armatimonadetes bacterium]|nr:hypothetical protein [Armatimonadota bacterium]